MSFTCLECHAKTDCPRKFIEEIPFGMSYGRCETCGKTAGCVDCRGTVRLNIPKSEPKAESAPPEKEPGPRCPKCSAKPEIDVSRIQYDTPIQVDCSACGATYHCSLLADFRQFFPPSPQERWVPSDSMLNGILRFGAREWQEGATEEAKERMRTVLRETICQFIAAPTKRQPTVVEITKLAQSVAGYGYYSPSQVIDIVRAALADFPPSPQERWVPDAEAPREPLRWSSEAVAPNTDDTVIRRTYVLVPKDMRCHKCGAPEPWKDAKKSVLASPAPPAQPSPQASDKEQA